MHDSIKMSHLIEWSNERKLKRKDIRFIHSHLDLEKKKQFQELYNVREIIKKEKYKSIKTDKRHLLCVFQGAEFCAELSMAYGRMYPERRIAIFDTDRLTSKLHLYLNCESHVKNMYHHLSREQSTGLNLLVDALHKNRLSPSYGDHLAIKIKGHRNIFYFSGSSLLEDYEYYELDDFKKIIEFLKAHYDIVILNTNGFIYDAFTCHGLMVSDMNILPITGQWPKIRSLKKTIDFVCLKQKISLHKQYYIMFDYQKNNHIDEKDFDALLDHQTLTHIPYIRTRQLSQERIYLPLKKYNRKIQTVYHRVIGEINRGIRKNELNQKSSYQSK